ncbi:MAG: ABC-2 transporter permease [Ruminococcus sp.]|nr:ABC-2 transporter permease [Ruminococcus sp.]
MLGYVYKDIASNKLTIIVSSAGAFFSNLIPALLMFSDDNDVGSTFGALMAVSLGMTAMFMTSVLTAGVLLTDERKKWAYFVGAAPDGVRQAVGGKYAFIYLMAVLTVFISSVTNSIASDLVEGLPSLLSLYCLAMTLILYLKAIELPFQFAFGTKAGSYVKAVIVVLMIIAVLIYFLFGDLSVLESTDELFDRIVSFITSPEYTPIQVLALGIGMSAVIPVYYISYRISSKVYMRGVQSFEK